MKVFVSHIAEEATSASALKDALERALPQLGAWVSSVDIDPGDDWTATLRQMLDESKAIVALCSLKSLQRPWVNFESGFGAGKAVPVIPVCHGGLSRDKVPEPLSRYQALDLREAADCRKLVRRLAKLCAIAEPAFDADEMVQQLSPRMPVRTQRIGVSLAHQQDQWPVPRTKPSLFAPRDAGLAGRWEFRELRGEERLIAADMAELSGLILGSPFRSAMSPDCVTEIVEWVHGGGRLLLLGYEFGDRHHNANLGALAQRFGLHPMPDIVGPPPGAGGGRALKPYDVPVGLEAAAADPHALMRDIGELRLVNLQTVMTDPDATAWLKVGRNAIYRIAPGKVMYARDGTFGSPGGAAFEAITGAPWVPVAAQAPSGLCGRGAVHFIGTWDLLPLPTDPPDQRTLLVERLLDWLSGKN